MFRTRKLHDHVLDAMQRLADGERREAALRGPGSKENNARVAQYLGERANAIEQRMRELEQDLLATAQRHGYSV